MRKLRNLAACGLLFFLSTMALPRAQAGEAAPGALAEYLYNQGYLLTLLGRYDEALEILQQSLKVRPTAEAYTYIAWTYSHKGDLERAIDEAKKAIRLDPDYGNPYNDIGVYLIELGKDAEAIPYLEKAITAKRYCCYQYPHFNLGRIYLNRKDYERAREEFQKSLAIDPEYAPAQEGLRLLKALGFETT